MLPLITVTNDGYLRDPGKLRWQLQRMKDSQVYGIMVDVWWGIVERQGPKKYDFKAYLDLINICKDVGIKMAVVTSFRKLNFIYFRSMWWKCR